MSKPRVLYVPTQGHTDRVFRPATFQRMLGLFDVSINDIGRELDAEQVAERLTGCDGLVTGWGSCGLIGAALRDAPGLRIVAHSAGSPKFLATQEMIDDYFMPQGITIFSANGAIALNVAEATVGMLIMTARRWVEHNDYYHQTGKWGSPDLPRNGQFLRGCNLGIVSASAVGREVIRLLQGWGIHFLCHDPYLTGEQAQALGVERVGLNDLFERADHVTIHAPKLPATDNMIGAEQLRRLRDGAAVVNTARGSVIDEAALVEEAQTGRLFVALDVTEPEPPAPDHPFQHMPNVTVVPHLAGAGFYGYFAIGDSTVRALEDCFAGRPVDGAVNLANWAVTA